MSGSGLLKWLKRRKQAEHWHSSLLPADTMWPMPLCCCHCPCCEGLWRTISSLKLLPSKGLNQGHFLCPLKNSKAGQISSLTGRSRDILNNISRRRQHHGWRRSLIGARSHTRDTKRPSKTTGGTRRAEKFSFSSGARLFKASDGLLSLI